MPATPVVVILGLCILFRSQATPNFRAEYDSERFPVAAADVLSSPEFASGVFAPDIWGGYLIYRLHPEFKAFIDGRSDFYGVQFDTKYLDIVKVKWDWQRTLDEYRVRTVLLQVDSPLAGTLKQVSEWRPFYDDGVAIAFRRATKASPAFAGERHKQNPAVDADGGFTAIARSQTLKPVIHGSQSYARR